MKRGRLIKKLRKMLKDTEWAWTMKEQLRINITHAHNRAKVSKEGTKVYFTGKEFWVTCGLAAIPSGCVEMAWFMPKTGEIDFIGRNDFCYEQQFCTSWYITHQLRNIINGTIIHQVFMEECNG